MITRAYRNCHRVHQSGRRNGNSTLRRPAQMSAHERAAWVSCLWGRAVDLARAGLSQPDGNRFTAQAMKVAEALEAAGVTEAEIDRLKL